MKFFSIMIYLLVLGNSIFAQTNKIILGYVNDASNHKPISDVGIIATNTFIGTTTNSSGFFSIKTDSSDSRILISKLGYERKYFSVNELLKMMDENKVVEIWLQPKTTLLNPATVNADQVIPITTGKGLGILDYDFWNNDTLLIIAFLNNRSKSKLFLLAENGDTISSVSIPGKPEKLFTDCIGNHYIIEQECYFEIFADDSLQIHLYDAQPIGQFKNVQEPCVASIGNYFYYSILLGSSTQKGEFFNYTTNNYLQSYHAFNQATNTSKQFVTIADRKLIRQLFEEKDRVRENFRNGIYRSAFDAEMDKFFAYKILYKETYAPLFKIHDSVFVFNFIDSTLQMFASNVSTFWNVRLKFGSEREFKRRILKDDVTEKLYAYYSKNGNDDLYEINTSNGCLQGRFRINRPFVENIRIHDDKIYFLYKDKLDDDLRILYKVGLMSAMN